MVWGSDLGRVSSIGELARREGFGRKSIRQLPRLGFYSQRIVEAIIEGSPAAGPHGHRSPDELSGSRCGAGSKMHSGRVIALFAARYEALLAGCADEADRAVIGFGGFWRCAVLETLSGSISNRKYRSHALFEQFSEGIQRRETGDLREGFELRPPGYEFQVSSSPTGPGPVFRDY